MTLTLIPLDQVENHPLVQTLFSHLHLRTFPFFSRIEEHQPWAHTTDTRAYTVYTQKMDIRVGLSVFRSAYLKVMLWNTGGEDFPRRSVVADEDSPLIPG
ncbi:MAG: hypothetical protein AAFQ98_10420 [Bacteroidota bacterium]